MLQFVMIIRRFGKFIKLFNNENKLIVIILILTYLKLKSLNSHLLKEIIIYFIN